MGLLDFIKNNYPGKKGAIKSTTVRVLNEFAVALKECVQENPNIQFSPESFCRLLQSPNFHNKLSVQSWTGREMGRAGLIIPPIPDQDKDNPLFLLINIVWNIVRFELSYDPTIGTEKDFLTVAKIVERFMDEVFGY